MILDAELSCWARENRQVNLMINNSRAIGKRLPREDDCVESFE